LAAKVLKTRDKDFLAKKSALAVGKVNHYLRNRKG